MGKRWRERELGHLRMVLERKQGRSVYEMSQIAQEEIKSRSLDSIMHKLREMITEREFNADTIELAGEIFPAKSVSGYIVITLPDGTKRPAHHWVWEQHYGKIQPGYHLHHIDGDTKNNNLNNLAIMSSSDHILLHYKKQPPETMALFYFLQEHSLWDEYLQYREKLLENFGTKNP